MGDEMWQGDSSPDHGRDRTGSNYDGYEFTFQLSGANSSQSSFIEPDPMIEAMFSDDSMSLTDSVLDFPELFGRTYHAYREGSYQFPNDLAEQERLELQNRTLKMLMGGRLYFAPLEKYPPLRVLDIATGTGDWPIAMGDRFPNSRVVATDLSPIQPDEVPPNVEFYVEDSSEEWGYSETFNYIHTRNTGACWTSFEKEIAQQAYDALAPGGWFESQELQVTLMCDDGTLNPNSALACWFHDLEVAADASLRPLSWANRLRGIYERVGFVDIQERIFKIPLNGWPRDETLKEIGMMWEQNMQSGLSGFSVGFFHRVFNQTAEQIEVGLVDVRREMSDPRIHAYLPFHVVWGRKPHNRKPKPH